MKIQSTYALIDVKRGRKELAKHFSKRPRMGSCPENLRIPVVITGYLDGQHGHDDGESIEFSMVVENVEFGK